MVIWFQASNFSYIVASILDPCFNIIENMLILDPCFNFRPFGNLHFSDYVNWQTQVSQTLIT